MGCGKKAWAEEIEEELFNKKVASLKTKPLGNIVSEIEVIQTLFHNFYSSFENGSRHQFTCLDDLRKRIDALLK